MYNIAEKDLIDFEEDIANCFNDKLPSFIMDTA